MRVEVLPFGILKEGISRSTLELPALTTVAGLLSVLADKLAASPGLIGLLPKIAVSVNAEYARPDQVLQEGDEIGLLPPVSGGSGVDSEKIEDGHLQPIFTCLTREPIASEALILKAKAGCDGAVVIFDGIVRDNTRGRSTLYLDYEAYEAMAESQIAALANQAIVNFGVRSVTLVHRLGRLLIGETSILIVVASAHRAQAFEASRWLIDTLKKTVPIWKKETFVDGVVWADGEPFPSELKATPLVENRVLTGLETDPQAAPEAAL